VVGEGSFLLRLRSTVCGEHSVVSQDSVYKAIVLLPYAPKVIRGANVCKPNNRGFLYEELDGIPALPRCQELFA